MPPLRPMLAKSVKGVPAADSVAGGLSFEPKWDGFRCVVFRDGDEVILGSRSTKDLARYFPELVEAFRRELPERIVVDGEIYLAVDGRLEFDVLSQRIHPAASRVDMLAETTPASFVAFDLLALGDDSWMDRPFGERRAALEKALDGVSDPVHVTRTTTDATVAEEWFGVFEGARARWRRRQGAGQAVCTERAHHAEDQARPHRRRRGGGVPAAQDLHRRTAAARLDAAGALQRGGEAAARRRGGVLHRGPPSRAVRPARCHAGAALEHPWGEWQQAEAQAGDRLPGGQSRWSGAKDLSFATIAPTLVAEVGYEHMEGTRFRHTAQFKRWRDDREPASCTYEQLEEVARYDLDAIVT